MRRLLLVVLALAVVPAAALGQAKHPDDDWWDEWGFAAMGPTSSAVLSLPLTVNGAYLADSALTVAHVVFSGATLVDDEGPAGRWTENGTVPRVASTSSPFSPGKAGAGPYSAANSFQGPTTLGEWTGDWSATVVFNPSSAGASQVLAGKGENTLGWFMFVAPSGAVICQINDGSQKTATTANLVALNGVNVATCGQSGSAIYSRLNNGTAANTSVGTMTAASAEPIRIGRYAAATAYATATTIYEVIMGTEPYSDALHAARWRRAVGLEGARGETITSTRATTRTCEVNGTVWSVAADAPCVNSSGLLVERASTNYVLNNRTHPKTSEATGSLSAGSHVAWHEGTGTMTVAAGTATVTGLSCSAVSPGTLCTFTVTVGGTMSITTSAGTVTKAQIETGATKTSEIPTTGTATARAADVVTVPTPSGLDPTRWSVEVTGTPFGGAAWGVSSLRGPFSIGTAGAANSVYDTITAALSSFNVRDASALKTLDYTFSFSAGSQHRLCLSNAAGTLYQRIDGAFVATGGTGAGSGLPASLSATTNIGGHGAGATPFDGYLSNFKIYRSPSCR